MKIRWIYFLHSGIALAVGSGLYLLFRDSTYLHHCLRIDHSLFSNAQFFGIDVLRYYLPDFLWAYSLYSGLCAVILPQGREWLWPALATFGLGVGWELAQYYSWVGGTSDIIDVTLYGAAVAVAIINFRRKNYV